MAYVIIADDDDLVTDLVRETFVEYGHTIGTVADAHAVLDAIALKNPDIVILDCNMPGNGILALREIRQSEQFFALPVVMLTARRSESDVEIALREGATAYVKKPFDPHHLVFTVEEILEKRAAGGGEGPTSEPPRFR
jgi:DNA-binding response OmpR family regulator